MIRIAIMGYGTIGSGVYQVLTANREIITRRVGEEIGIKYVLDLRDFPGDPVEEVLVHDVEVILNDPEVSIVVEVMGGVEPAYTYVKRALLAGKSVVTSNKALVAAHGTELIEIARKDEKNFLFEASVGGAIPIIRPLYKSLPSEDFLEITGILNGTTNYMLTKMSQEGVTYDDVLAEAQAKGFAERDPSADVDGWDACRKIAILSSLAYEKVADYEEIPTEGISKITPIDFRYAKKMDMAIKLLASSWKEEDGIHARVCPSLIGRDHPLYMVNGVFNAILVRGNMAGDIMFYGSGAGSLPTASAVVGDIIDAAKHPLRNIPISWGKEKLELGDPMKESCRFFLRIAGNVEDRAQELTALLGDLDLITLPAVHDEFGIVTEELPETRIETVKEDLPGILAVYRIRS